MKNVAATLIFVLIALAFSGVGMTEVKSPTADSPQAQTSTQATFLTGRVTSLDRKAGTLVVKASEKEIRLSTDSKSGRAALNKLAVGDTVRVFARGGKVIAVSPVKH